MSDLMHVKTKSNQYYADNTFHLSNMNNLNSDHTVTREGVRKLSFYSKGDWNVNLYNTIKNNWAIPTEV